MSSVNGAVKRPEPVEQLLVQLNDPRTAESLSHLLKNAELLAFLLDAVDGFIRRGDVITDNISEALKEARPALDGKQMVPADLKLAAVQTMAVLPQLSKTLPQLVETLPQLVDVGLKFKRVIDSDEFDAFLESGMLAPKTVQLLGQVGDSLVETEKDFKASPKKVGLFGLWSALSDPDIQLGLGFLVEFGKRLGQKLKNQ